ncbi:MAG: YIP1 family protein [Chloroflexota bacterium]|nr:YIP1 family protein [Chloroflexota bacterium]
MFSRILKAAMLDVGFYKEAEADTSLNQEALMVVILVSVAGGIGAFLGALFGGTFKVAVLALIVPVVLGVVNYYIWAYVTYFIGSKFFDADVDPGEMLRVLGYASGPRALSVLGFIPCLGGIAGLVGAIWALVAGFIGTREALDLDTGKTIITIIIGWVIVFIISLIIGSVLGIGAMGVGAAGSFLSR